MKRKIIVFAVLAIVCAAAVWLFTCGPLAHNNDVDNIEETDEIGRAHV